MRLFFRTFCLVMLAFWSQQSVAYGHLGHELIAHGAEKLLTEKTRASIREITGGESFIELSWWADAMRSEHNDSKFWGYDHAANWHFVNIPPGREYDPDRAASEGDIVQAIAAFSKILNGSKPEPGPVHAGLEQYRLEFPEQPDPFTDRAMALKFLVHLIADIHQPLHVGHGVDRGGNDIAVSWFGRNTNLHAVWDTQMIRSLAPSTEALHDSLKNDLANITPADIRAVADSDIMDWVSEGLTYRNMVYASADEGASLRSGYTDVYGVYARNQLLKAIVRTAATLNSLLDPDWELSDFP